MSSPNYQPLILAFFLTQLIFCPAANSQSHSTSLAANTGLTHDYKTAIVQQIVELLHNEYVLPDKAEIAAEALQQRLATGGFDDISDLQTFANRLTGSLDIIDDWHLGVNYNPDPIAEGYSYFNLSKAEAAARDSYIRSRNFGFEKVERLPGNIGYIELREFIFDAEHSEQVLASAMNFVAHTDGLIIDLRRNGGGQVGLVELFVSYLTDKRLLIGTTRYRADNKIVEHWTANTLLGQRFEMSKPIFIVTSSGTFSAAEAFTYALQTLERVTVVGETTIGGAHPFENRRLDNHLMLRLPVAQSIDPRTGSNWQYVGIQPDQVVASEEALDFAHAAILQHLIDAGGEAASIREKSSVLSNLRGD